MTDLPYHFRETLISRIRLAIFRHSAEIVKSWSLSFRDFVQNISILSQCSYRIFVCTGICRNETIKSTRPTKSMIRNRR